MFVKIITAFVVFTATIVLVVVDFIFPNYLHVMAEQVLSNQCNHVVRIIFAVEPTPAAPVDGNESQG